VAMPVPHYMSIKSIASTGGYKRPHKYTSNLYICQICYEITKNSVDLVFGLIFFMCFNLDNDILYSMVLDLGRTNKYQYPASADPVIVTDGRLNNT
jgi:hypothetical protein